MSQLHHIEIRADDDVSWVNWGKLIYLWLEDPAKRPNTVAELEQQWIYYKIVAEFKGDSTRAISVEVYDPSDTTKAYVIALPTKQMVDDDHNFLKRMYLGSRKYPIPDWYSQIFEGNPAKRRLGSEDEMLNFGFARLGEYVINECM